MKKLFYSIIALLAFSVASWSQPINITVTVDKPVSSIPSTMWGIFFEDINFAADGGLYAELVKNRSFEFASPMMGWKDLNSSRYSLNDTSGAALVINRGVDAGANPRFARITVKGDHGYGLSNEGFRDMGIKKDMTYNLSMMASQQNGSAVKIRVQLIGANEKIIGETTLAPEGATWKKYTARFKATETDPKAKLNIWFNGKGVIDVDMISLFPSDTWKNRPNGMRADLVQLLADLNPGFIRFPGGCIVEGRELATRYQWKKTVGPAENRELIVNRWNTEFAHRPAPDYFQSFGLGFFEYFQLAEDLGASPLPVLSCGMACQFNSAEVVPMDELDPYIQDALDLIDFANGNGSTPWSKLRLDMGHPAPFNLKMIGVGNEQWGSQYIERYTAFAKSIKEKYPEIKIVASNGPGPGGELFEYADKFFRSRETDIIDEHYYNKPDWFLKNAARYDSYDRKGPKIFAGEYAAQSVGTVSPLNKNNWETALAEAAFMTGLERNAAVVNLCSYAPLFAHVDAWQWTPDLIWFDNLKSYGTPNYYVQKLFSTNRGSDVILMMSGNAPLTGQQNLYASAVLDRNKNEIVMKLVNAGDKSVNTNLTIAGVKKLNPKATMTILKADARDAVNSIEAPMAISPVNKVIDVKSSKLELTLEPLSFYVIRVRENH
jgi:alpha-N-arabinofuranosidase